MKIVDLENKNHLKLKIFPPEFMSNNLKGLKLCTFLFFYVFLLHLASDVAKNPSETRQVETGRTSSLNPTLHFPKKRISLTLPFPSAQRLSCGSVCRWRAAQSSQAWNNSSKAPLEQQQQQQHATRGRKRCLWLSPSERFWKHGSGKIWDSFWTGSFHTPPDEVWNVRPLKKKAGKLRRMAMMMAETMRRKKKFIISY